MKSFGTVIKNNMKSPCVRAIAARKGWSQEETKNKLVDFVLCGRKISLHDFLESEGTHPKGPGADPAKYRELKQCKS